MTVLKYEDEKPEAHREGVPKLLKVVLGDTEKLETLGEFLRGIATSWPEEAGSLQWDLERAHDHPAYRDLLHTTWCYTGQVAKRLQEGFTLRQYSNQSEVVDRALNALMCSKAGQKNVLCYGHRQEMSTMRRDTAGISSGAGKLLLSPAWEVLLSRIGDTLMLYILLNVSIFLKMENHCYFQLSGYPIINDARITKRKSDALLTKFHKKSASLYPSKQTEITQHFASVSPGDGKSTDGGQKRSKKRRPSSWQRKKYRKALESGDQSTVRDMKNSQKKNREYITQHLGSDGRSSLGSRTGGLPQKSNKVHYRYPMKFQSPSEMVFPCPSPFPDAKSYNRESSVLHHPPQL